MSKWIRSGYVQLVGLVFLLMGVLLARLFVLAVLQKEQWTAAAEELSVKTIYTAAPRGQILDRKGRVLAGNTYTMSVRMSKGSMTDEKLNASILRLARTLKENGDELYGDFPVRTGEKGKLFFDNGTRGRDFFDRYGFSGREKAEQVFSKLRKYFKIDNRVSDEDARSILTVRNEMAALGYKKYMPVTVAKDLSRRSIAVLEENSRDYPGAEVFSQVSRDYPEGRTASHILGYLGKISDSEKETYVKELGYQSWDMIGKDGIEKVYEKELAGTAGRQKVQVNAAGSFVKTISRTEPRKGRDVTLTIDLELQKTAESALKQAVSAMSAGGTFVSRYGNYAMQRAPKAESGAVVALDVKTGQVLAMASCPDFDPNLFANGISAGDWESLQSRNPRDPLAPAPLYNVAAKSAVQPGSTFKMATALAAVQCGLDPEKNLYDNGCVKLGNNTFGCVVWNRSGKKHGYLNMQQALEVSCNYYFFDAATGTDFYTGGSLGYKMTIDTIMDYAAQLGLGQATGIEIPETVTGTPSGESKLRGLRASLKNLLLAEAETYFETSLIRDRKALNRTVETITGWIGQDQNREETGEKLKALKGIRQERCGKLADLCQYTYMNQAAWNQADALNIAIGQGLNSYTPLQMAGYTAALGNKGVRNPLSLVAKIEGHGKIDRGKATVVKVKDKSCFDTIIGGMTRAASGPAGSLTALFQNFPVTVAAKTGTAQRAGKINPPDEEDYIRSHLGSIAPSLSWDAVQKEKDRLMREYPDIYTSRHSAVRRAVMNLTGGRATAAKIDRYKDDYDNFAWVVAMAPAENPEIAAAVMIVQGGAAANAGPVAREIIGSYFQQK